MEKLDSDVFCDNGYDAVVVGSGYGGSVAACRLSMAGFKVCLVEKGRRWEAQDFPTDCFKMMSAVRMGFRKLGFHFGSKNALFQLQIQEDALVATACGLGGGSLINAGVMVPPTFRARKHPKWPKAWEKDWDSCQACALDMLRAESVPMKFQNSEIVEGVLGEEYDKENENQIKLSVNFDVEQLPDSKRSPKTGSCLACGNCLSGCPYGAKGSTDRTYLASAVEAGCTIKTESEVQYVVRNNKDDNGEEEGKFKTRSKRRWLVFLNEFDYIEADIVILSAGVFGTARILFQSRLRGLQVSQKLGSGLSCNGNYVAYLAGSRAPLSSTGLNRMQFLNKAFGERPGPSISSSYTSSLGFTIQSAVTPAAYPSFLFKGIATYALRTGGGAPHTATHLLKHALRLNCGREMVLNVMGHDNSDGRLTFDKDKNVISFQPPHDRLLPRKVKALEKIAGKLGGILFLSRFASTAVHLLGGCIASSDSSLGVCDPEGRVFDTSAGGAHMGLYVCDASLIPCSVGINPCLTIATLAEHVSRGVVRDNIGNIGNFVGKNFDERRRKTVGSAVVTTREVMRGKVGGMPCTAHLKLRFGGDDYDSENAATVLRGRVGGYVECRGVEIEKMYVIHGEVDLCKTDGKTPYTQYMHYRLLLAASSGSRYILEGRKIMNPYLLALYAWRESTTLNVTLRKITDNTSSEGMTSLKGKLHVSLFELLKSLCALEGRSKIKFVCVFMQSLFRTYILQTPRGCHTNFTPMSLARESYPNSTIHEIQTEDNITIRCEHWQCSQETWQQLKHEKRKYPALLLNGYATESYYLPTEQNDLIRTLLRDGHDVWLLHARMHWSIASNQFSVEDIGRFDIPAAIDKITDLYGESVKLHVVAHCLGGLAIHISLMGGHVSAKYIASLTCTNSSMFYKLTTSSLVKMWLPLVPMSMAVLGTNKILPMLQESSASYRHRLLKSIARLIPRCQRCTCDECEVISGIFGNAYWHENISPAMHYWMNKENLPRLPMAAFPHLRKICRAGFIVDSDGKNSYLIYPERMAMPTLYISGGRTLLVTPETSFLANKYMKMHQPGYRHERVVVDGFGHSDLLIGEESGEIVFPHITKHMELAEEEMSGGGGGGGLGTPREAKYVKEALAWSVDPYEDEGNFRSWVFALITVLLLVLLFIIAGFLF
ncbi:Unknown protein [Striga hermonthica]|uniref:Cholesterol oxidase n=1 Tax=Striga hermonthica TaxID=68872 RepID=A0A9N7MXR9_STRHE|nr:Unknown protein [Striga hermonthica]